MYLDRFFFRTHNIYLCKDHTHSVSYIYVFIKLIYLKTISCNLTLFSDRMIGQGETQCVSHCKPEQVMPLAGHFIDDIAAGAEHTLALAITGQVWGWGINTDGQLGLGHTNSPIKDPALLTVLSDMNIKQVKCYQH